VLAIRPLHFVDARPLLALIDANREHLAPWLPWPELIKSPQDAQEFIRMSLQGMANHNAYKCVVLADGMACGLVSLHWMNWGNRSAGMSYWLGKAHEGQGIAAAACRILEHQAFADLELNKIEIHVAAGNLRSHRLAERLGYAKDGVLRQAEFLCGQYVDHVIYSKLRQEWAAGLTR
jgi:ribosomal-protein-serine acetyltransferase